MKPATSNKRALCLWLPHWPLQRLCRTRPELKRIRVAIYNEYRPGCLQVVECSRSASECGVKPGMPLAEALALAKLHLEKFDPIADNLALDKLAAWCEQFSPVVSVMEPDCLLMDLTGLAHLFAGEENLVNLIHRAFQKLGLVTRIALTDTFAAAWALTHVGERDVMLVSPGRVEEALADLPVRGLNLSDEILATLGELGIETIGQILAIPRASLAARFEPQLLRNLEQATGEIQESLTPYHAKAELAASYEFESPIADRSVLEFLLADLLEPMLPKILAERKGITKFQCEFWGEKNNRSEFQVSLFQPTANFKHLRELVELRLEKLQLPGPIQKIRLHILGTDLLATTQLRLFCEASQADERRHLAILLNRLTSRLGDTAVLRAVLVADAQAEYAYRYHPVNFSGGNSNRHAKLKGKPGHRPLQLLPTPFSLQLLGILNGPPKQFEWQGGTHSISATIGPERIEVGWWRGNYVKRDYFRVETEQGNRFWLFRDRQGRWFLHGIFD